MIAISIFCGLLTLFQLDLDDAASQGGFRHGSMLLRHVAKT